MDTPRKIPSILVVAYRCPDCRLWNYHHGSQCDDAEEGKIEAAEMLGCQVEDLMAIPEVVFCQKCEGAFELEDDIDEL